MQKIIKIVCLVCLNVNNNKSYYSKQHTGMPLGTHIYNIIVEAGYPKPAYIFWNYHEGMIWLFRF